MRILRPCPSPDAARKALTVLRAAGRIVVFGAALLAPALPGARAQSAGAPLPAVSVAPAANTEVDPNITFTGRVRAVSKIDIRARVIGFLEDRHFVEGRMVKQGDPLFTIESGAYEAAVTEIRGAILAAEAQRDLAKLERARQQTLVERETGTQQKLDRAIAEVGSAEGEILRLQGALQRAELDLSYTRITAPFDGVIGLSSYDVGEFVGPESGALATLTSVDPMEVVFPVSESLLLDYRRDRAERGDLDTTPRVRIRLSDGETYPEEAKLDFVDVQVSQGTDTILLRASIANPGGALVDGQLVVAVLSSKEKETALTVPQQAIQRDVAGSFVLLVNDESKVERRAVTVSYQLEGKAVIADGLKAGEMVIVEGVNKVRAGVEVDAAPIADPLAQGN